MSRYKPVGWRNDSYRHSLAARRIRTSAAAIRGKNFVMSDVPTSNLVVDRYLVKTIRPEPDQMNVFMLDTEGWRRKPYRQDIGRTEIMEELYPETAKRSIMVQPEMSPYEMRKKRTLAMMYADPETIKQMAIESSNKFNELVRGLDRENIDRLRDSPWNTEPRTDEEIRLYAEAHDAWHQYYERIGYDWMSAEEMASKEMRRAHPSRKWKTLEERDALIKDNAFWNPSSGGSPFDGKPGEWQ